MKQKAPGHCACLKNEDYVKDNYDGRFHRYRETHFNARLEMNC